ncbi:asparagine synthase (glutamine-hydrolyzing) [Solibacillus silvestris]|uniref:asparagine synthase (glutamine-hydrolyzing) n=1 Tax=Solibacillus silvestris TaxID=76853 RepID=UPI003F7F3D95
MCGIAAIYSTKSLENYLIKQMTDLIKHRGPDGEGHESFLDGHLWFGHRRLSIIDLSSAGHQPMSYLDERYWITYNGEVYNYLELRDELEVKGYQFQSNSDTEVILAAYAEWGKNCLNRFNGMWSFVIFDRLENKFFAARDRFGVKPLYYWYSPEGMLAFASEIKQFTVLPGWEASLNGQRAYDFLNWSLTNHTDETLFENVFQIRGGEAVVIELENNNLFKEKSLNIYQWYTLKPRLSRGTIDDIAEKFRQLFTDSIKLRLRADVAVGSCLSGGLDSSSIVCVANDLLDELDKKELQKTFSACSHEKKYDERYFIDKVVQSRDIEAHYTYPELNNLFPQLEDLTWHQDEPFGSTSVYAQWEVFKLAAEQKVKVVLDGQGADEQLAGYHGYFSPRFTSLLKSLDIVTLLKEINDSKEIHGYSKVFAIKQIANAMLPEVIRQKLIKVNKSPTWLDMERLGAVEADPFVEFGSKASSIRQMSIAQLTRTNLPMLLHWEDRDSMAHTVESRLPFLDYRLVEFILGLPDSFKLSDGITKKVLREGMKDILPEEIRMRMDKLGFVTPEEVWIKGESAEMFLKKVKEAVALSKGVLKEDVVIKAEAMIAGQENFSFYIWRVISFGEWIKKFNVKI